MRRTPQIQTPNNLTRAATLAPSTFDAETNTVELVLSTGADVRRAGYVERLPVANADLRGIAGAPLLDAHNQGSTRAVIGVIEKAWRADGEIRARVKLSKRQDVAGIVDDVREGILRNVSIGYAVERWKDETNSKGERVRVALSFRIIEASLVPIGADAGAVTRSNPVKKTKKAGATAAPQDDVQDDNTPANAVQEARDDVRATFTRAMPNDLVAAYREADQILDGADEDDSADDLREAARTRAAELIAERTARVPRVRVINPGPSPEQTSERRIEGLSARVGGGTPSEQARAFVSFSLVDHARDMLEAQGVRTRGMNTEALLTRAMHTVSDFPELLSGTGARLLRTAYEAASSPLVALCRPATANDFRTQSVLQVGELPKLGKVLETGEIKSVTRGEAKESWALSTYGAIFSLSRQALINDDLSAFADFARDAGQAAAATVADLVVTKLTESNGDGPTMGDGVRMFHADHGNIGAGEVGLDAVSEARRQMLTQTGVDGSTIIRVNPDTLVVPPSQLTLAEQFCATITPATSDTVNPFASKLTPVVEPLLEAIDSEAWYLADSRFPALILGGLAGNQGPQIASRDGFEVLGREFRVTLDVGVGPYDFRGWFRSSGATG